MIIFTGGGSGGHAMVASTLIKRIQKDYPEQRVYYVGSKNGIEKSIAQELGIEYSAIHTGKLRRYFSLENIIDVFKVFFGIFECFILLLGRLRETKIIFSTGGFVSVPASLVGAILGKKIYLHEQTSRLGLANKIIAKFADKVFISFEESFQFLPSDKTILSGYPLRQELIDTKRKHTIVKEVSIYSPSKPLLFITGGGNGSKLLNDLVKKSTKDLCEKFIVFHQVGRKFFSEFKEYENESYKVFDFIGDELVDILKASTVVICRAGAGTVSELIHLNKNTIFIPLKIAQRNEQYHNATEALKFLNGFIIQEDELGELHLISKIEELLNRDPQARGSRKIEDSSKIILKEVFF